MHITGMGGRIIAEFARWQEAKIAVQSIHPDTPEEEDRFAEADDGALELSREICQLPNRKSSPL